MHIPRTIVLEQHCPRTVNLGDFSEWRLWLPRAATLFDAFCSPFFPPAADRVPRGSGGRRPPMIPQQWRTLLPRPGQVGRRCATVVIQTAEKEGNRNAPAGRPADIDSGRPLPSPCRAPAAPFGAVLAFSGSAVPRPWTGGHVYACGYRSALLRVASLVWLPASLLHLHTPCRVAFKKWKWGLTLRSARCVGKWQPICV